MATISKLATSQYLTDKHWGYRDGSQIKYIIPHHMAGKMTGANCSKYFVNNGLENSANYCIGYAGDISCNVVEDYGAWTSSFSLADKYAITIEVSDTATNNWTIPGPAQEALIQLMVDLIQRYPSLGGKAVYDPTDEAEVVAAKRAYRSINAKGNVLLHNWTSAYGTTCPEWHMKKILPEICAEVNRRLAGGKVTKSLFEEAQYMLDNRINGNNRVAQATKDGFKPADVQAEIDLILAKDPAVNVEILAKNMTTIKKGASGNEVLILQHILSNLGYLAAAADGSFGAYTDAALKAFQNNINTVYGNFAVDGICGPKTWSRLLLGK